jgi:hypothetical protein
MAPLGMHHYPKAQTDFKPPLIANENAYLGDVFSRFVSPHPSSSFPLPSIASS